jgi:hypothetical protein
MLVLRQHEGDRVVAVVVDRRAAHAGVLRGAPAMPPVQDHALIDCDRIDDAVDGDVVDQLLVFLVGHRGEGRGKGVLLQGRLPEKKVFWDRVELDVHRLAAWVEHLAA